ncbi:neural cell adhesion molecule 1-like [Ptychodera flava]|uniref:neural cell adhesion molecule 1-like n=1 Tax=Ptychodera flava TaxID=63121 RepID=UPI00396AA9A6
MSHVLTQHQIIHHPIDTLALEGREAQLNCTVEFDGPAPSMKWYIHDATVANNILTDGNFVYEPDIYSIDGNQDQGEYNLVISRATSDLQAVFICVLRVDLTTNATLFVMDPAIVNITRVTNNTVVEGDDYFAECEIEEKGNPDVIDKWYWYFPDGTKHDNGILNLTDVHREDNDEPEVEIQDISNGNVVEEKTYTAEYDPILKFVIYGNASDTGKIVEGDGVSFECDVIEANPAEVTVLWQNQDVITEDNWLNFTKVLREHHGEYTCVANNTFWDDSSGTGMVNVSVDVQYSPEIIMFDNITYAIEGREFIIVCQVSGNPTPNVKWLYNGNQVSQTETLQYEDIQRHQSGEYTCEANNIFWNNETAMEDEAFYLNVQCSELDLHNVTRDRTGEYVCFGNNTYHNGEKGTGSNTTYFDVQYLSVVDILGPSDAVEEGKDQVTVTCTVTDGVPDPNSITLFHVNESVNQIDNVENQNGVTIHTFDLGVVHRWNNGSYYCIANTTFADQSVDSAISTKIPIIVHYKPSILDEDNETIDVTIGSFVSLNCTVDAYPDANVTWKKDGENLM